MKHITLGGEIVFEKFTKTEGKKTTNWCKRLSKDGDIIKTTFVEEQDKFFELEIDNEFLFKGYLYYYGGSKAYNKLKEIGFKFE